MKNFTQTIKSVLATTGFALAAMVSSTAFAVPVINEDGTILFATQQQAYSFCAGSYVTCSNIESVRGGYLVTWDVKF